MLKQRNMQRTHKNTENRLHMSGVMKTKLLRADCTIKVETWDQQNSFNCSNEFCFEFNEFGLHHEFMNEFY